MYNDGNQNLRNLCDYLADKFPSEEQARLYGTRAEMRMALVLSSRRPLEMWHNLIQEALPIRQNKLDRLFNVLLSDYPDDQTIQAAGQGSLTDAASKFRIDNSKWLGEPVSSNEKLLGKKSTLLPISFLEKALEASRSVAKVVVCEPNDSWTGTGFLLENDLFVTNNHVIPNADVAAHSHFLFNYHLVGSGPPAPSTIELAAPGGLFLTSEEHDCTFVSLRSGATGRWGKLQLSSSVPAKWSAANIIQHPQGRPKEIGLYRNYVMFANQDRVQYLTDTEPGSSGAPVFDAEWKVVALHHSGGWIAEPQTENRYYRNEGIAANRVLQILTSRTI